MNAKKVQFNVNDSSRRVEALLARDMTFAGAPLLPSEEDLQPNKGLYLDCSILCLRIKFPKKQYIRHQNKMYAFIFSTLVTEVVNVFETVPALYDVKPEHNRLWGVFKSDTPASVNSIFKLAIQVRSLMDIVNHKLENRLRMSIDYTIGLDAGTAILMKSDLIGRLESDKVWVGDHFDACYKMAGFFREKSDAFPLRVSGGVYQLLTAEHRLLCKWHDVRKFYHCNEPEVMLNHPAEVNYYTS